MNYHEMMKDISCSFDGKTVALTLKCRSSRPGGHDAAAGSEQFKKLFAVDPLHTRLEVRFKDVADGRRTLLWFIVQKDSGQMTVYTMHAGEFEEGVKEYGGFDERIQAS